MVAERSPRAFEPSSQHSIVLGGGGHLMGEWLLGRLAGTIVLLQPLSFHFGLLLDNFGELRYQNHVFAQKVA